ncbi:MAG TPA: hypothetical protein VHS80_09730 [Chthoniobacterales bacterium]|nr:hypothetical protein [Chthoniobacterales bacterium]
MSTETRIEESLDKMVDGWQRGDGKLFAQPFAGSPRSMATAARLHGARGRAPSPCGH